MRIIFSLQYVPIDLFPQLRPHKSSLLYRFQEQPPRQGCESAFIFSDPVFTRTQIWLKNFIKNTFWRVFLYCSWKKHKRFIKSKKQWSLCKFTFKMWTKLQLLPISSHFFCFDLNFFIAWFRIMEEKWMQIRKHSHAQRATFKNSLKRQLIQAVAHSRLLLKAAASKFPTVIPYKTGPRSSCITEPLIQ